MRIKFTAEMDEFLRGNAALRDWHLAERFNAEFGTEISAAAAANRRRRLVGPVREKPSLRGAVSKSARAPTMPKLNLREIP